MGDLYTSYSTSVALRDAGAPQEKGESYWAWKPKTKPYRLHGYGLYPAGDLARIFRADELVEALGDRLWSIERRQHEGEAPFDVGVRSRSRKRVMRYGCASLVEALAAAWLAVLTEGGKRDSA